MPRCLLVRMSSLGDILHTFPVATDIARHRPDLAIDWVAEEAYEPLVRLHPGVARPIPIAWRRWRRRLHARHTWREMRAFRRALAAEAYEAVLDTQGLVKSAVVARLARGPVHGFGPRTAREPVVARFYAARYEFAPADHKIERYREVAARALGYPREGPPDYGIVAPAAPACAPTDAYCVLLHATARRGKLWDEERWVELGRALEARGLTCVLPWGSAEERARSQRIAARLRRAAVPPRLAIGEAAGLIGHARAVAGVDTGLMHLAAALRVPVVGIFTDSEPLDAQPRGLGPATYRGGIGTPPASADVLQALAEVAPGLV